MSIYAFFFGIITFFSTLAGGLFVLKYRNLFGIISALAGGVLLAVSFFDLLPQSLKLASELAVPVEYVMYSAVLGFIFLLIAQRYFAVRRVMNEGQYHNVSRARGGWVGTGEIAVHAFIEGVAIGLSFKLSFQVGVFVALAIIAHDFCDGINAVTVMLKSNNTARASFTMLLFVAAAPLLGVASNLLFSLPESYLVLVIPFLMGGFLYLGPSDCLPEAFEKNPPWVTVVYTCIGILMIFFVSRVAN